MYHVNGLPVFFRKPTTVQAVASFERRSLRADIRSISFLPPGPKYNCAVWSCEFRTWPSGAMVLGQKSFPLFPYGSMCGPVQSGSQRWHGLMIEVQLSMTRFVLLVESDSLPVIRVPIRPLCQGVAAY